MGMDGLGITGASLRNGTQDANDGIEVKLELTLFALWCVNGAVVVIVVIVVVIAVVVVVVVSWFDKVNGRITNLPAEGAVSFSACRSLELLLSYLQVLDVSGRTVLQRACPSNPCPSYRRRRHHPCSHLLVFLVLSSLSSI